MRPRHRRVPHSWRRLVSRARAEPHRRVLMNCDRRGLPMELHYRGLVHGQAAA